jgi:LDH2 family malate/lactate/ureidoglycolate dehydrogenase
LWRNAAVLSCRCESQHQYLPSKLSAGYTSSGTPVDHHALRDLLIGMFCAAGMVKADAALLAETLVAADLGGTHSHGVIRVPEYVKKLTRDGVEPRGVPSVVSDRGSALLVDGGNSMGQIACQFAMRQVIDRAKTTGIAAAAVRGSNHCGACSYYAEMALADGMIGIATTNALPTMAPDGGADRVLGINPLAVAIPAGEEHPISYDAAFSGTAHGKIRVYEQKGMNLPSGWALDREGAPTTSAAAAIEGLLVPIGGFKGASLAMIMGILSSMLSGAAYGTELGDMESGPQAGMDGQFLMALNITAFVDLAEFKSRVDAAIREIKSGRRAAGVDRLWVAGEKEFESRARNRMHGIPLNEVTLLDIATTARSLGIDTSAYAWLPAEEAS